MNNGYPNGQYPGPGNQQKGQQPYAGYQQNGYYRQGGYAQPQGYPQNGQQVPQQAYPQGAYPPQQGYPRQGYGPNGQPYAQPPQPYPQNGQSNPYGYQGYPPQGQSNPYTQTPQPYPQRGQSNPYVPQGYPQGGQPYPQGYPQNGQQGYGPQAYPQNGQSGPYGPGYPGPGQGGQQGYVVNPVDPNKQRPNIDLGALLSAVPWQFVAVGVSLILFAAAMLTGQVVLSWCFAGAAFLTLGYLWLKPQDMGHSTRLTLTILLLIALVVTAIRLVSGSGVDSVNPSQPAAQPTANAGTSQNNASQDSLGSLQAEVTEAPVSQTYVQSSTSSDIEERLQSFMYFWSSNNLDQMLNYCAPSWARGISASTTAVNSLYQILALRIPILDTFQINKVSGSDADVSSTVTMTVSLNRNNNRSDSPQTYIFNVLMLKEDGSWYVDPRSLQSNVEATATPASSYITQPPQPATSADANTPLYYNPDGGKFYHLDPECKSANVRNLPFKGKLTYGQLNEDKYKNLEPCSYCDAPLRPGT
ncbi:MAG: hypothetical protein IKP40_01815 [Clostridia bacterium]|nr:hypothetical protein [Clostridia bacterium]